MIAKRIPHKTECDHAQTPYARRKCRAAKLAAAAKEATMQIPTVIDGFELPDNATDVRDWYSYAASNAAMYADDDNGRQARAAYRELHAARQAMELFGLRHGGPRR